MFIDPNYLDCVLAAGDLGDVDALRAWLVTLPVKSYGRVFIEIESAAQVAELPTPPGVGITWIERETAPAGEALARAVDAWLDEWLRGDPLSGRHVALWLGAQASPVMRSFRDHVENELAEIWAAATEYRIQSA